MKRLILMLCSAALLSGCGILANTNLNEQYLAAAATQTARALTLTDSQVAQLSLQTVHYMDSTNVVENGKYKQRLDKVMKGVKDVDGRALNFKVYKTSEVNAFACGDGSIRVYSGLMDVMDDDELVAIIGHEIGHIAHKDTKTSMQKAYMASAARYAISSVGGTVGTLSASVLGDLAESYLSAAYSRKQEYAADDYGYDFAIKQGRDPYSMYNALSELVTLSSGSQASIVQKMFASHPGSEERAKAVKEKADKYTAAK